jgi:hypothetical protein
MRTGTHFRTCVNVFFDVRSLRSTLRSRTTTTTDKQLARAYLADISSFKTILSSTESYDALEGRVNEIQALGEEYFNAFIFFAPWLEMVGGGTYRYSIWYELSAAKSVHVLYELSKLNAMPDMAPEPRTRTRTQNFLSRASGKVCSARVREVGRSSARVREFTNAEILVRLAREHFSCSARLFTNCS